MTEHTRKTIESERGRAVEAIAAHHPGLVRVCCRRAAGAAISELWSRRGRVCHNAMDGLDQLSREDSAPVTVRTAAFRLRAKRQEQDVRSVSINPIRDLDIILAFIGEELRKTAGGE